MNLHAPIYTETRGLFVRFGRNVDKENYYFRLVTRAAERWPEIVIEKVMNSNSNLITCTRSINSNFVRTNRPCYMYSRHTRQLLFRLAMFFCDFNHLYMSSVSIKGKSSMSFPVYFLSKIPLNDRLNIRRTESLDFRNPVLWSLSDQLGWNSWHLRDISSIDNAILERNYC